MAQVLRNMKEMAHSIKKYLRIYAGFVKQSFAVFFAHRFEVIMSSSANIIWTIGQIISLRFLFTRIPGYEGWDFGSIVLLLAFGQISVYISWSFFESNLNKFWERLILAGELDRVLTKPLNIYFQISFRNVKVAQIFPLFVSVLPMLVYGTITSKIFDLWLWSASVFILILGIFIVYLFSLALTGLSFFMEDIQGLKEMAVNGVSELNRVPLDLFPKFVKTTLTFIIPQAFAAYYPIMVLRGKESFVNILSLEIILIIVFMTLTHIVWSNGLKRYAGVA